MTSTNTPLVMSASGPVPSSPAALLQALLTLVASENPGYTANLPGSLIEDISSTDVGALVTIDQARVEAINSVTPYGANAFVLAQLGAQAGLPQGLGYNTSVYVVLSGTPGYVIPVGFVVSDGTYQYVIQNGGVIETDGLTTQLFAVANQSGSWAVPSGTVTQVVTSVASGYTVTVTNPQAGTPAISNESVQDYRARVIQAQGVTGQGTPAYIKTQLQAIPGVVPRLVSILQVPTGWEIICGGGDAYAIANAIYLGAIDLTRIVGSSTSDRNVMVTLIDGYDSYTITFVIPPQQTVNISSVWNTTLPNFTAGAQVNQLATQALQSYINSIPVGQPINILEMTSVFQTAVVSMLPTINLTSLAFTVKVNGVVVTPSAGTSIIPGDSESYFYADASAITVTQG